MTPDPTTALSTLAGRRVFFGHQSVGGNILDGVRDWQRDCGVAWPIADASTAPQTSGALVHAAVGRNGDPASKRDDFRRLLDGGTLGRLDAAVLKYCYVDVQEAADAATLCDAYIDTLEDLAGRHAGTVFVPATVPVTHAEGGLGVAVRELLGRPNHVKLRNLARQAFNDRLRQRWTATPIVDVAAAESTRPDGGREVTTYRGRSAENLVAAYTDDGRHLNGTGRRHVAAAVLQTLAAVAART
ncbi:MAG: hypothetical protein R2708_07915 [Vicinamibacterales bacterium]